ncbi:MAG TPA: hypothetical protein VGV12_00400 [Gemmatimonadales bacterium]|nr:hypothetical protein [Gemmatimonadales bacterium]
MTRTILAAAVLIGLVACTKRAAEQSRASRTRHPAATQPKTGTTAAPAQAQKRKGAAKPDTGRAKNPLTNN